MLLWERRSAVFRRWEVFKAMLCGAVVFGQKKHMQGLGLVPGKHFIDYDGTLEGLLGKMRSHAGRDLNPYHVLGESPNRATTAPRLSMKHGKERCWTRCRAIVQTFLKLRNARSLG